RLLNLGKCHSAKDLLPLHPTVFTWTMLRVVLTAAFVFRSITAMAASVPAPYTPLVAHTGSFKVLNRKVEIGPMLLPPHIIAKDAEVLASPVSLVAEPANALAME